MSFDAYRIAGPLSFVPRLETRRKRWRGPGDAIQVPFYPQPEGEELGQGHWLGPNDNEPGQPIESLDAKLELPTKRSTVHNLPYRIRVRYRVHFMNGSLRDFSRAWALDNLQEWQPSMPTPGAANPEVRIAPMTPDEEQRLLVAIDEALEAHGSHLAGFEGGSMSWNDFNDWLKQNGFQFTNGNIHWLGRGWWYPAPPAVEHDAETLDVAPPWIHVEKEQQANNVFVNSNIGGKTDSAFCDTPECARAAAETALMALFLQLDRETEGFSGLDDQVAIGAEHELEHTTDRRIARQIALDHLREDPDYYRKLTECGLGDDPGFSGYGAPNPVSSRSSSVRKGLRPDPEIVAWLEGQGFRTWGNRYDWRRSAGSTINASSVSVHFVPAVEARLHHPPRAAVWEVDIGANANKMLLNDVSRLREIVQQALVWQDGAPVPWTDEQRSLERDDPDQYKRRFGSLINNRWDNDIVMCTKCERQYDMRQWQQLPLIGNQPVEADEEGPAYVLECRNCNCGSTLAVDLK